MNKIFKLFSVLTVLLLVMGLSSCVFIDAGSTDPENYGEIDTAAKLRTFFGNNSKTATLSHDIELDETVEVGSSKTKTLDLNGYTITYAGNTTNRDVIAVGGKLTILDGSTEEVDNAGCIINDYDGEDCYAVAVYAGGTLVIQGGQYMAKRSVIYVAGTASISSANLIGDYEDSTESEVGCGVFVASSGTLADMNCSIEAKRYAVYNNGTITKITGGSYLAVDEFDDSTANASKSVVCIFNNGSIGNITATQIKAENLNSGNAYGIYNKLNKTHGVVTGNIVVRINGADVSDNAHKDVTEVSN